METIFIVMGIFRYRIECMQNKFKAIGFDWSGVIFFHAFKYHEAGSKFLNISKEEFQKVYFKYNHLINISEMNPKDFWTLIFRDLGRESEVQGFLDVLSQAPRGQINEPMLPFISLLKKKGYSVGLFSNNSVAGAMEARSYGVDTLFPIALFSAEIGYMKPHKEGFEILAEKLGVQLSEMVFIDDAAKSLEKASEIGYTPILYKNMSSLLDEFVQKDILTKDETENLKNSYERL